MIDKILQVFGDLGDVAVDGVKIGMAMKGGVGVGAVLHSIGAIKDLAIKGEDLIKSLPGALPELAALSAADAQALGQAALALVQKISAVVKG
jgi:hypothetical protein